LCIDFSRSKKDKANDKRDAAEDKKSAENDVPEIIINDTVGNSFSFIIFIHLSSLYRNQVINQRQIKISTCILMKFVLILQKRHYQNKYLI
jgi:hypothetical protein